jgi:hypothetical protein
VRQRWIASQALSDSTTNGISLSEDVMGVFTKPGQIVIA